MASSRQRLGFVEASIGNVLLYKCPDDGTVADTVVSVCLVVNYTPATASAITVWHLSIEDSPFPNPPNFSKLIAGEALAGATTLRRLQGICLTPGELLYVHTATALTTLFHLYGQENRL